MAIDLGHGVAANVYPHQLGALACTSYVTDGLGAFDHPELVMTMAGALDPTPFLRVLVDFAQQGRVVEEGQFAEVGPPGMFGREDFCGVTYQRAWPMHDVPLPDGALAMIVLVGPEMEVAKRYGPLRVLARLGSAHRFFPTAVWCDVNRAPVCAEESQTVLASVPIGRFGVSSVVARGYDVVLSMPRSEQPMIASNMPPAEIPVALTMSLAHDADSCLVWSAGQQAAEAISLPDTAGACLSGCFVLFVPGQTADECNILEDGFVCMLTDQSWQRIRTGLAAGTPVTVPCGPRTLELVWT
ncbi:DUF3480 domain-containing protein [Mycobacterium sp. Y57]|uniref:TGF-beta receptor interacting domain-containing protein n=1 Tax=Mycolicibacterium xanthum TaxID=2796469 RepID=UPI001C85FEFB|nr:DUF3480 domain-containing protein [Mycolicibacterium xanthum]MBX7435312.1 DUF3480 domain-containing protein [Mycolicibacterium xanthum]